MLTEIEYKIVHHLSGYLPNGKFALEQLYKNIKSVLDKDNPPHTDFILCEDEEVFGTIWQKSTNKFYWFSYDIDIGDGLSNNGEIILEEEVSLEAILDVMNAIKKYLDDHK
jgi:hypothetical protein